MGRYLGRTRQTIWKWVKELKDAGLITCENTGSTCIINFTPVVTDSIQACKDYHTQESNKRNKEEKVYKTSFSKNKSLSTKDKIDQYNEFNF